MTTARLTSLLIGALCALRSGSSATTVAANLRASLASGLRG